MFYQMILKKMRKKILPQVCVAGTLYMDIFAQEDVQVFLNTAVSAIDKPSILTDIRNEKADKLRLGTLTNQCDCLFCELRRLVSDS